MEPALPEETVTKNDVQKASSERVGPMDDVLDSEVPVEIVQKQSLLRKRLPAKTADAGTVEEIALAALEMKSHMEGEIQRLRLENEAMRHESLAGRRAGARRPDPQGALSPTPPVPPPAKSPFKSPPFASPEARSAEKPRREASSPVVEELASLRRRNAELQRELQKSERAWQTPTATSRRPSLSTLGASPVWVGGEPRASPENSAAPRVPFFAPANPGPFRSGRSTSSGAGDSLGLLAAALDVFPPRLRQGGFLWKVPFSSSGVMPQKRWFRVALRRGGAGRPDEVVLTWCTSRATTASESVSAQGDRSLSLEDVLELRGGHQTPAWWVQAAAKRTLPVADLCWSLVSKDRTLDVAAEDDRDARAWKRGLRAVVAMLQRERALRFSEDAEQPQVDDDLSVRSVALASSRSGDSRDSTPSSTRSSRSGGPASSRSGGSRGRRTRHFDADIPEEAEKSPRATARTARAARRRRSTSPRASGASTCARVGAPRGRWVRDNAGKTPAHVLLETRGDGGRDVLAVLLDAAGDDVLEARDDGGDVVLHVAARVGALRCARLLLQTACDPSPKNHDGLTPGDVARSKRDAAIANLIDEYGFDGEPTDFSAADDAPAPPLELFATAEGDEWQKLFCHDNQHPYYEHIASGHTQWEDPRADDGDGDGAALPLLLGAEAPETEEPEEDPPTSNRSADASPPRRSTRRTRPEPAPALAAPMPARRADGAPARKPLMPITNA
ncbi:hypothetical protein JL721_1661 [Aureococcus anophagefferens]|nr:hypothetical protein JL721_1661 [Aureococcus anophagefferens]